jgi:putative transposase
MISEPVRARIRRLYAPNAVYFITCVTQRRQPIFVSEPDLELLRETMRRVKDVHPFRTRAYAFLHDHFHLLIFVPETTDVSRVMHSIQRNFTLNYKRAHGVVRRIKLWQRGFWDHVIRDERDFVNHFHYIHYNPVKHGYVSKPEEYPHTSFHEYVQRGWYEIGWGHVEPEELKDLEFE